MGVAVVITLFNASSYHQRVLPAFQALDDSGNRSPLLALLRECHSIPGIPDSVASMIVSDTQDYFVAARDCLADAIQALERSSAKSTNALSEWAIASVLELACVPRLPGLRSFVNLRRGGLLGFLTSRSRKLESLLVLGTVSGGRLRYGFSEWSGFFTPEEAAVLRDELATVGAPEGNAELAARFSGLRALVKAAFSRSELSLVMSLM